MSNPENPCTSCRISCYALCTFFSMPTMLAFTAFPRLSPPMGLGTGYKVATCQASHLTRRNWFTLPKRLTCVCRCHVSCDRLKLASPPCLFRRQGLALSPCPVGTASINPAFFAGFAFSASRKLHFFAIYRKFIFDGLLSVCATRTRNFMQTFSRLTVDKIFGAKNASIYGEKGDFCPVRGDFHGDFSALTGGFSRGKGRDRHGNRISTKGRDRHGETRGKNRRIAGKAGGDCLTRGKQAGNRQGQAGQAETGKRQHNRVLCGLLRLKSNITSKQPYPSHPTS